MKINTVLEFDDISELPEDVQVALKKEVLDGLSFSLFHDGVIWVEDVNTDSGREPDGEIHLLYLIREGIERYSGDLSQEQREEANEDMDRLIGILQQGIDELEKAKR